MTILALEFSSDRRSVALARGGEVLAEAVEQTADRGTKAFSLIEKVLSEAKVGREEIGLVAVGLGPGSYTGIRAAIAIAQGWHLATGVNLVGVSSVEAMALEAQAQGLTGKINLVVDAQRGEFYLAGWEINESVRHEVEPLKIVAAEVLAQREAAGEGLVGPEKGRKIFPSARMVARLAAAPQQASRPLEPIYLRETSFVKAPPSRML